MAKAKAAKVKGSEVKINPKAVDLSNKIQKKVSEIQKLLNSNREIIHGAVICIAINEGPHLAARGFVSGTPSVLLKVFSSLEIEKSKIVDENPLEYLMGKLKPEMDKAAADPKFQAFLKEIGAPKDLFKA